MTIAPFRRFTADDAAALSDSALRFCERHSLDVLSSNLYSRPWEVLDDDLCWRVENDQDRKYAVYLKRLWQACRCRALRVPVAADVTVGYGYVGHDAP